MNDDERCGFTDCVGAILRFILVLALIGFAVFAFRDASADHSPSHKFFNKGEYTKIPARVMACLTHEQASVIYDATEELGAVGFQTTFGMLSNMKAEDGYPVCGVIVAYVKVLEVYKTSVTPDNVPITLIRVQFSNGEQESDEFYSVILHVKVNTEDSCEECI